MPLADDAKISVNIELPTGYNLSETEKVVSQIENRLKKISGSYTDAYQLR